MDGFPPLFLLFPRPSRLRHPSPHFPRAGPPAPVPRVEQPAVHAHTCALTCAQTHVRSHTLTSSRSSLDSQRVLGMGKMPR